MADTFVRFQEAFYYLYAPIMGWLLVAMVAMAMLAAVAYIWLGLLKWLTRRTPD